MSGQDRALWTRSSSNIISYFCFGLVCGHFITLLTAFLPGRKVTYFLGSGCFTGSGRSVETWRVQGSCRTCGSLWWAGNMLRYGAVCLCYAVLLRTSFYLWAEAGFISYSEDLYLGVHKTTARSSRTLKRVYMCTCSKKQVVFNVCCTF